METFKYVLCKAKQVLCTDAAEGAENCAQCEIEAKVLGKLPTS